MDSAELTSWSIILGAAAGRTLDRDSFTRRYGPVIRSYLAARWRVSYEHESVADATGDVFVEFFKGGGALERVDPHSPGGFRAYLYGVVRNVALNAERKQRRRRDPPAGGAVDMDELADCQSTLSRVFDRAWAEAVVREARALMAQRSTRSPAAKRRFQALGMRFERGLAPRQMVADLGLEVEQVYELLREARREFKSVLLEVMATYHPTATEPELEQRCVELLGGLR